MSRQSWSRRRSVNEASALRWRGIGTSLFENEIVCSSPWVLASPIKALDQTQESYRYANCHMLWAVFQ